MNTLNDYKIFIALLSFFFLFFFLNQINSVYTFFAIALSLFLSTESSKFSSVAIISSMQSEFVEMVSRKFKLGRFVTKIII